MAQRLRELGFENSFALLGGFDAWREAGYPLERMPEQFGGRPEAPH